MDRKSRRRSSDLIRSRLCLTARFAHKDSIPPEKDTATQLLRFLPQRQRQRPWPSIEQRPSCYASGHGSISRGSARSRLCCILARDLETNNLASTRIRNTERFGRLRDGNLCLRERRNAGRQNRLTALLAKGNPLSLREIGCGRTRQSRVDRRVTAAATLV